VKPNMNHVKIGEIHITNVYAPPNDIFAPTLQDLDDAIEGQYNYVIAVDLNGRWPEFTKQKLRDRDIELLDFVSEHSLVISNDGTTTLIQQGRHTVNDYTFTKNCKVEGWQVDEWTSVYSTHFHRTYHRNHHKHEGANKKRDLRNHVCTANRGSTGTPDLQQQREYKCECFQNNRMA